LLRGHEKLESTSQTLHETRRLAEETADIGAATLGEMGRQREQLENARDRVCQKKKKKRTIYRKKTRRNQP